MSGSLLLRAVLTGALGLSLAACAKDPDYGTGTAGTSGGGTGGSGGGAGSAGSYTPPTLKLSHPSPIISRGKPVFASTTVSNPAILAIFEMLSEMCPPPKR